jgi:hypothetical protein
MRLRVHPPVGRSVAWVTARFWPLAVLCVVSALAAAGNSQTDFRRTFEQALLSLGFSLVVFHAVMFWLRHRMPQNFGSFIDYQWISVGAIGILATVTGVDADIAVGVLSSPSPFQIEELVKKTYGAIDELKVKCKQRETSFPTQCVRFLNIEVMPPFADIAMWAREKNVYMLRISYDRVAQELSAIEAVAGLHMKELPNRIEDLLPDRPAEGDEEYREATVPIRRDLSWEVEKLRQFVDAAAATETPYLFNRVLGQIALAAALGLRLSKVTAELRQWY